MQQSFPIYDVVIVGGGVSGTALLYVLARYTNLKRIALIEKYDDVATVNSNGRNNSQTLHCGDIETNYTLEKALQVQRSAAMVVNYCTSLPDHSRILFKYSKMVLGVGADECNALRQRFKLFKPHFPAMRLWERDDIARVEPKVVEGRKEEIVALGSTDEYSAVDFQALSRSFVEQASRASNRKIDVHLSTRVTGIARVNENFHLHTSRGEMRARFVVVSAGGHSLLFAQRMGYGREFACMPVAGSFYYAPGALNGKVYTVQNEKLPFAAIHGDPDVVVAGKTRFGPTAIVLPVLERYKPSTFWDYMALFRFDMTVFRVFLDLMKVSEIRRYMLKNILFEVPFVRTRLFLNDARKIVPTLSLKGLHFARHIGGIRPVMIERAKRKMYLGEAKINTGEGIVFNMTPSPGATSCLDNAEKDARIVASYLNCKFDDKDFARDLVKG